MTWHVYLKGAQVDLDALARMFPTGPLRVAQSERPSLHGCPGAAVH